MICGRGYLKHFTKTLMYPLHPYPKLELVIVMIFVPLVMNVC